VLVVMNWPGYTNILIHALFSTKDRQPWLDYDGFPDAA
jgi:hypothetical protein